MPLKYNNDIILFTQCLETLDSGKPYTHTFFMDTTGIAKILRYYAGWTDKIHGKTVPVDGNYLSCTLVQPMGVCGLILPVSKTDCLIRVTTSRLVL